MSKAKYVFVRLVDLDPALTAKALIETGRYLNRDGRKLKNHVSLSRGIILRVGAEFLLADSSIVDKILEEYMEANGL